AYHAAGERRRGEIDHVRDELGDRFVAVDEQVRRRAEVAGHGRRSLRTGRAAWSEAGQSVVRERGRELVFELADAGQVEVELLALARAEALRRVLQIGGDRIEDASPQEETLPRLLIEPARSVRIRRGEELLVRDEGIDGRLFQDARSDVDE